MNQHHKLFERVQIGTTFVKNRVGVAPMTRTSASPEGLVTDQMAAYYASFARGGFGFVITEGTYTDELYSQCYFNQPGLVNDEQASAWKKVVDTVHEAFYLGQTRFCSWICRRVAHLSEVFKSCILCFRKWWA